jgi:hypothetical protein
MVKQQSPQQGPAHRAVSQVGNITGGGIINSAISPALIHKRINRFRVSVATPPAWKVKAIARYKEVQAAKKAAEHQHLMMLQNAGISASTGNRRLAEVNASAAAAIVSMSKIPGIGKAEKILCIQKEKQNLENNSELMKNEIKSLHILRSRLLWLLNKSALYETERNHAVRKLPLAAKTE